MRNWTWIDPLIYGFAIMTILLTIGFFSKAKAHDPDHPHDDAWYSELKQPDDPAYSCCGVADGYFCDDLRVKDGKMFCTISDDRPDEPRRRPHIPVGTVIEIPKQKLIDAEQANRVGNSTGHGVIWVKAIYGGEWRVYCYMMGMLM